MTNNTVSLEIQQATPADMQWVMRYRSLKILKAEKRTLAEAMERTGKSREELQLANRRRRLLRYRHILKVAKQIGPCSLRELERKANACLRTVREALKYTYEEIMLLLREAFLIYPYMQEAGCGAVGDVQAGYSTKISFFASLSLEQRSGNCSGGHRRTAKPVERSETGAAAINQSAERQAKPIRVRLDEESGEVMCMSDQNCVKWTPSPNNPKPPGNPFLEKRSEKKIQASTARTEPPTAPMPLTEDLAAEIVLPPHSIRNDRPVRNASSPSQTRETFQEMKAKAVPPPPEYFAAKAAFMEKCSMEKKLEPRIQEARAKIDLTPANQDWFNAHKELIDAVLGRRRRPFKPLGYDQ